LRSVDRLSRRERLLVSDKEINLLKVSVFVSLLVTVKDKVHAFFKREGWQIGKKIKYLMGIAIIQDNKLKYANELAASLAGFTVSGAMDLSPTKLFELIHPQDRIRVMEQLSKKQSGSTDYITNYQYRIINNLNELMGW